MPGQTTPSAMTYAELVVVPVAPEPGEEPPSLYGLFAGCNPMLGPPHGGSPACNRAITRDGTFDLLIPPGQYYVYGTRGPFATIDRAPITVAAGDDIQAALIVQSLPILPGGVTAGDFHVHGAASYDSSIPDLDRVISFLTAGLDVVVATDHDVVTSYDKTITDLSLNGRLTIIPGVEQTPNIPWFTVPGEDFPQTLGPLQLLAAAARPVAAGQRRAVGRAARAGTDDGRHRRVRGRGRACASSIIRSRAASSGATRASWRAIGYDPRTPIVAGASFAADMLLRQPDGGRPRNLDWDVQEVMNGASRGTGCAIGRCGSRCCRRASCAPGPPTVTALAGARAGRVPAQSRVRCASPGDARCPGVRRRHPKRSHGRYERTVSRRDHRGRNGHLSAGPGCDQGDARGAAGRPRLHRPVDPRRTGARDRERPRRDGQRRLAGARGRRPSRDADRDVEDPVSARRAADRDAARDDEGGRRLADRGGGQPAAADLRPRRRRIARSLRAESSGREGRCPTTSRSCRARGRSRSRTRF